MSQNARVGFDIQIERFGVGEGAPRVVVAVPVKDEAERIGLCLEALALQEDVDFSEIAVVLLLNNCTDGTADQVREIAPLAPFRLEMHSVELPAGYANAGWARKLAMDAAERLVASDGLILTTDADTLPLEEWIASNRREIENGHDAVAGYVMAHPMELMELPEAILERGSLEWEYQQLAAELDARVDPEVHDAWPRHNQNCGASAAVTAAAYRAIGGLPPRPVGEDRALFQMLRRMDGRIRHSLEVQVYTSARTDGRASGGLADEIRLRTNPNHPCDDALEVAISTFRRALWRSELRTLWQAGQVDGQAEAWGARMRIPAANIRAALGRHPYFGAFWAELEGQSPRLAWRLVTMAGLKRELRRIRRLVDGLRARDKAAARAPAAKKVRAA